MSAFLARVDKTKTRCFYEITFDKKTKLPTALDMYVLTGVRGETTKNGEKKLENEEHVAFIFKYEFSEYGKVARFDIPRGAAKLLAKK